MGKIATLESSVSSFRSELHVTTQKYEHYFELHTKLTEEKCVYPFASPLQAALCLILCVVAYHSIRLTEQISASETRIQYLTETLEREMDEHHSSALDKEQTAIAQEAKKHLQAKM